jgi:hypothetical protein
LTRTIPTGVPATERVGNTWQFYVSLADYPASDGWTLALRVTSRTSATQDPLAWDAGYAVADGDRWLVTIPTTATADLTAGNYEWVAFVTGSGDTAGQRYSPASGRLQIDADLATATAGSAVDQDEIDLATVRAERRARVTGTGSANESVTIDGRSITRMSMADLLKLETTLAIRVNAKKSTTLGRRVHQVFTEPGCSSGNGDSTWA